MRSSHCKIPMRLCSITITFSKIDCNSALHFKSPMRSEFGKNVFIETNCDAIIAIRKSAWIIFYLSCAPLKTCDAIVILPLYLFIASQKIKSEFYIYYKDSPISDCYVASPEVYRTHYKKTIHYLVSMRYTTTLL